MKKTMLVILMVVGFAFTLIFFSCSTTARFNPNTPQPDFDKPNSVIVNASLSGYRYNDYVKLYNLTTHTRLEFHVYAYDENTETWIVIGQGRFRRINDVDTINSVYNRNLKQFRWFAIHSLDGIDFKAQVRIDKNDVRINIFE